MAHIFKDSRVLVADPVGYTRNLLTDVLRGAGFTNLLHARDGNELLTGTVDHDPKIVITTSRLPGVSGLEYARLVRAGHQNVTRQLPIIVMTDTPTKVFLQSARDSGVDEMFVRPFSAHAVLIRVRAVIARPRQFIESVSYVGPCRRRRMVGDYNGPTRRFLDPIDEAVDAPWESAQNRAMVRRCVNRIGELVDTLTPGDRRELREIYAATQETKAIADQTLDAMLAGAAKSLGRYIMAVGASADLDSEVIVTHIDALHALGELSSAHHAERRHLVDQLNLVVEKKLGRNLAA